MKVISLLFLITVISACSTVSGTVKGFGEDVKQGTDTVSDWIKSGVKGK